MGPSILAKVVPALLHRLWQERGADGGICIVAVQSVLQRKAVRHWKVRGRDLLLGLETVNISTSLQDRI